MSVQTDMQPIVLAISGGIDSVVLLDVLARQLDPRQLIVAHFDHGIRPDSSDDALFVGALADRYGLRFEAERKELGATASEEMARAARYEFLHGVRRAYNARAIVTAHHQDDLVETAVMNLLRGTGRKGLGSLRSTDEIWRPLLSLRKRDLEVYARTHGLHWREDSTNSDTKYRRNYVRRVMIPKAEAKDPAFREKLLAFIDRAHQLNGEADNQLDAWLTKYAQDEGQGILIPRHQLIMLSHAESREVIMTILRKLGARDVGAKNLERFSVAAKTAVLRSKHDVCCHIHMQVLPERAIFFGPRT